MSGRADRVAAIVAMSAAELIAEWERVHRAPAPAVTPSLLARDLAHQAQLALFGGPDKRLERRLRELVVANADGNQAKKVCGTTLGTGTQLLREWGGRTHRVSVEPDGRFFYAGRTWTSLSAIAREITGARWSGPRFFGTRS
ncbi:DUF2924 domain-containing protein [Sphingomonas sp. M1-B02]|uniref:DUF2924 domain-containing protein n=1 Tax=Sphingomonas sp. M1-B02 TaxID=3114300 RepID=UPI002240CA28|nr:DUF2924 domain-containing protein [Sphingomonas sp. S6-11]UZK66709.1 DUF2924 domain-containing protein [Sphingomonas sp. S6-11]